MAPQVADRLQERLSEEWGTDHSAFLPFCSLNFITDLNMKATVDY
jgi:hypothetical protein